MGHEACPFFNFTCIFVQYNQMLHIVAGSLFDIVSGTSVADEMTLHAVRGMT